MGRHKSLLRNLYLLLAICSFFRGNPRSLSGACHIVLHRGHDTAQVIELLLLCYTVLGINPIPLWVFGDFVYHILKVLLATQGYLLSVNPYWYCFRYLEARPGVKKHVPAPPIGALATPP